MIWCSQVRNPMVFWRLRFKPYGEATVSKILDWYRMPVKKQSEKLLPVCNYYTPIVISCNSGCGFPLYLVLNTHNGYTVP